MSIPATESAPGYLPQDYLSPDEGKELPQSPELSRSEAAQTLRFCRIFLNMLGVQHDLPESLSALGPDYAEEVDRLMQEAFFFFRKVREILPDLVSCSPRLNCLYRLDFSVDPLTNIKLMIRSKDFDQVAEALLAATKLAISHTLAQRAKGFEEIDRIDFQARPDLVRQVQKLIALFRLLQGENLSWPQLVEIFMVLNHELISPSNKSSGKAGAAKTELAILSPIIGLIILVGAIGMSQLDFDSQPPPALTEKVYTDPDEARGAMKTYLENNWSEAMNLAFQGHEVTAEVEAMIHGYKEKIIQEALNRITKAVDMEVDFRGKVDLDQTDLNLTMIGPKKDTLEIGFPDGYTIEKKLNPFELVDGNGSPELYARVSEDGFLHYLLIFELENPNTTAGYCATLLVERTGQSWRDAEASINRGPLGDIIADQFDSLDSSEPITRRLAGDGWAPVTQDQDGNVVWLGLEADLYRQAGFMMEALQPKLVEIAESGSVPENSMCLSSPSLRKIHHELAQSSMPAEGMYFEAKVGAELQVLVHNWVEHTMKIDETIPMASGDCGQIFESRRDLGNYLKDYLVTAGTNKKPTIIQIGTSRYLVVGTKQPVLAEDQSKIFVYVIPYEQVIVRGQ